MELAAEMTETIVHKVELSMLLLQGQSVGKHFPQLAVLQDVVKTFRAKLVDSQVSATKQGHSNVAAQAWLKKVQAVLYDIEHLVDQIYTAAKDAAAKARPMEHEVGRRSSKSSSLRLVDFSLNYRWNDKKIREMRDKFSIQVAETDFPDATDLECRSDEETTDSKHPQINRDSDQYAIIQMLQAHDHAADLFSAVFIYGKAGLGKTTLAQLVFNDSSLQDLDLRFWVWLGNKLNPDAIISTISDAITSQTTQDSITGKILLLVLDDVRSLDVDTLVRIRDTLLRYASATYKVVITTRSEQVATINYGQISTTLYELKAISDEGARKLFMEVAFHNDQDPNHDKDLKLDLGWELLKRTNNVPRTIKDLASLVNGQHVSKWKALMNADFSCLRDGYSPFSSGSDLAFRLLPSPLKRCFAYSALFRQYEEIEMRDLVHLWIAQGYIKEQSLDDVNQSLEEVAEEYYRALGDWSFFKEPSSDFVLAKSAAASEMQVVHFNCANNGSVLSIEPYDCDGIYHLFINNSTSSLSAVPSTGTSISLLKDFINSLPPQLRSFLKSGGSTVTLTSVCDQLFSRLGYLRALDLNNSGITMVPASIGLLKYLRYLNLSINDFTKLPDSITALVKLQVLNLSVCKKLLNLPTHFSRLRSLRHLYLDGCESLKGMPIGLCKMTALQTLNLFVLGKSPQRSCKLSELSKLNIKSDVTYKFATQSVIKENSLL